jgi:hypothetical protein
MASDQENPRKTRMSGQRCDGAKMTIMKTPEHQAAYDGLLRLAASSPEQLRNTPMAWVLALRAIGPSPVVPSR